MKRLISIWLLIVLSYQCCSCISIFSWYLLRRDYITRELCVQKAIKNNCCKGRCYLGKQLKEAQSARGDMSRHNQVPVPVQPFMASDPVHLIVPLQSVAALALPYAWYCYASPCFKVFHPPGPAA